MDDTDDFDSRLSFLMSHVINCIKTKADKWYKMMCNEEFKRIVYSFLNTVDYSTLFIALLDGVLMACHELDFSFKYKTVYFLKKQALLVTEENVFDSIIVGDLVPNSVDQFVSVLKNVYIPILLNERNHTVWPSMCTDDIRKNCLEVMDAVSQIQGVVSGKVYLPIPENIQNLGGEWSSVPSHKIDLKLKSSIENAVVKWTQHVNMVIFESYETQFTNETELSLEHEIKFWRHRLENLKGVQEQLQKTAVKKMFYVLKFTNSVYFSTLNQLCNSVEKAVTDSQDIIIYLAPIWAQNEKIDKVEFKDVKKMLPSLIHMICFTWVHCRPIRAQSRIVNVIKEICNTLIKIAKRYLNETSLFDSDISDTLVKLTTMLDTLCYFIDAFENSRCNLSIYFQDKEFVPLSFETESTFIKLNSFITRLLIIQKFFRTILQYNDLEKIEFGGNIGHNLSLKAKKVFDEFVESVSDVFSLNCRPLDLNDDMFMKNYIRFSDKVEDMDKRLATVFMLAFDECSNMVSFLKIILMLGDILNRQIIRDKVSHKYRRYQEIFDSELNSVKKLYEDYRAQFKTRGRILLDKCYPPCAGSIASIIQLRQRIVFSVNSVQFLENVVPDEFDVSEQLSKCDQLLLLLEDFESEIGELWCDTIPRKIDEYLSKSLFILQPDGTLKMNFNRDLTIILKETRYLKLLKYEHIPECAEKFYDRSEELHRCLQMLGSSILWYNEIKINSKLEEINLIDTYLAEIQNEIDTVQCTLDWNSDIQKFVDRIYETTNDLYLRIMKIRENLSAIEKLSCQWNDIPLFSRKDTVGLLFPSDRAEQISVAGRRYIEIFETTRKIFNLLDHNIRLFCNLPARNNDISVENDGELNEADEVRKSMVSAAPAVPPTSKLLRAARKSIQAKKFELKSYRENQRGRKLEFSFSKLYTSDELDKLSVADNTMLEKWNSYLSLVEKIVHDGMFDSILYSLTYILEEMNNSSGNSPLFQLFMNLNCESVVFTPSLDEDSEFGLVVYIENLIKDITNMVDMVPQIYFHHFTKGYDLVCENIDEIKSSIFTKVKNAIKKVRQYVKSFDQYNYLWSENMDEYLEQFLTYGSRLFLDEKQDRDFNKSEDESSLLKETCPKLEDFKNQIDIFIQLHDEIQNIHRYKIIDGWLQIDVSNFTTSLLDLVDKWSMVFKNYLVDHVNNSLQELKRFIEEAEKGLMQPLDDGEYSNLVKVMTYIVNVRDRAVDTDFMFEPLQAIIDLLMLYDIEFSEETYCLMQELPDHWNNTKRLCLSAKSAAAPFVQAEVNVIRKRMVLFDLKQTIYKDEYKCKPFFRWRCELPYVDIDSTDEEITRMENTLNHLIEQASLFEIAQIDSKPIQIVRKNLKLAKVLWDYILIVKSWFETWKNTKWKEINSEAIDIELKKFSREIKTLEKDVKEWEIYVQLEIEIKDMITSLREVTELQNPAIRERHWKQLMLATKVNFIINDETTLSDLLELDLYKFEDEVKTIVDKSVKEMLMEKSLNEFASTWAIMEFQYESHPNIDIKLIKCSEDVIEKLEDNQIQLQNMMSSKFISHFMNQVSEWQQVLANTDQIICMWMEVQRTWLYLQSIFVDSQDICKQFPEDSKRFAEIDEQFKKLLEEMLKTPNILNAVRKPHLYENLEKLQNELCKCEKALTEFLESKRLLYPRFYFISPADLLDILANGNQPDRVCRHLTKLYDSISKLEFTEDSAGKRIAVGMYSKDGEYVNFCERCICSGQVENWLSNITSSMRKTGRSNLSEAVVTYEEKPREQWLFDYPAQTALCATQIWWTNEVNTAFTQMEEGYENALKDYNKKQVSQLNSLISLLLNCNLSTCDRQKITTICTIDVHSRDVVSKLISERVESASAFQWQSQLRHRWDTINQDCFVNICDAEFRYNHEYLGNTSRLVITPLTDRCYITLTQSLHLVMGGAAAGPAGTGKTETTKDLGKALGMMVYVFNCSEQMDYKSCGNIYKGLAQTGAWGCFDEFNRIAVDVLSVVAVQVKCVLDAVKAKRTVFNFIGEKISLVPTVGMFITMNPGYAGRTELPENLKALYRPCAMVVPDFKLICEIMLVTEGFKQARVLARKFITLYSLCKELLSKQDHYDWGLRAIKSLLVLAGKFKREDPDRPEEETLMRALRDFNIPKIVTDDVPIFISLIHDLFPNIDVPRQLDENFEKQAKQAAIDLKLQPEDSFILKVVQLRELFQVRHSVFIVGNAGTGKTQVWKTLFKAYQNMKMKPFCNVIEPKSVTNDELFGAINPTTREWKDGLFSALIREQAQMSGMGPKWMVMDGDIDPMWIESLNTLMDDNKVLTLASNERISLNSNMWLLFEVSSLHSATPATVSRAGILYINPQDLGWNPYVTSWIETRTNESEKANLIVLFDKYVPTLLEACKTKFKKVIPVAEITHIQMLCTLLEALLIPSNVPRDCPKEWYELYFVFACIWAFGSALYQDQAVDYRNEFTKWWTAEFRTIKFPSTGYVFDYCIDNKSKRLVSWNELIPKFELNLDIPLSLSLVHTMETLRIQYFIQLLISRNKPVMLVGTSGCGKTSILSNKLSNLPEEYSVAHIPFNYYTTSETLQKALERPLEKKAGRNYGPPCNKSLVYFIDDMNLPKVDKFGTVQPHTLIRQHLNYGSWYDRMKFNLKDIHNIVFVSCMNPCAGSGTIDPRLQRFFYVFYVSYPTNEKMFHIYNTILNQYLLKLEYNLPPMVIRSADTLVQLALATHSRVAQSFLPTVSKFHYIFNMKDLTSLFQGLLFANPECLSSIGKFVRLWLHEAYRTYSDKLTDQKDKETFNKLVIENVKKYFPELSESEYSEKPLIYCHFADGIGTNTYLPVSSWLTLHKLLTEAQSNYNELESSMSLVFFEDAMVHVCRVNRILENSRGNALLIGVGGSGKQSLARLAAFISSLEIFQIQIRKGYGIGNLRADIANLFIKTGLKNVGVMFLITDAQISDESFLVPINDILAYGETPDLFSDEEVNNIINTIRSEVKGAGISDSRENCWSFFINKVKSRLKIVLCLSPVGSSLRTRMRRFPAISNCTSINWFQEWPQEALESVSYKFLSELEIFPEELRIPGSLFMAYVHISVRQVSKSYLSNDRRFNYTTPKTFLEYLFLYKKLLEQKINETNVNIERFKNGIQRLVRCAEEVDELKENLAVQEIQLAEKKEKTEELIKIIEKETVKTKKEKAIAADEERKVRIIEEDVSVKQKICEEDLRNAEPMLIAAKNALNILNKSNLTELKSFGSPPAIVANVTAAVMVLLAKKGKIPKDRSWKACKVMMAKLDAFLDSLVNYSIENISQEIVKGIQPYLRNPDFNPDLVRTKSSAAAGLCEWVINIMKYYEVWTIVEPKRKALDQATSEYSAAQNKLAVLNEKIESLEIALQELKEKLEDANEDKDNCIRQKEETAEKIDLANRLVKGLASENIRWRENVTSLQKAALTLPGEVLLVTAIISYVGCFTRSYRTDLLYNYWLPFMRKLKPVIPVSCEADPLSLLADDAQIASWNNEGLPSDKMSTENAMILLHSNRWPLIIDPQLQGVKWIKTRYSQKLRILQPNYNNILDVIEKCLIERSTLLIENIDENIDPLLDNLIGRNLIRKGRAIKIGDKEIDFNSDFRLILQTKFGNPHYKPEIQAQTTLINFTVTKDGLEEQLLADVMKIEIPHLEHHKANLTKEQNDYKIKLKALEDELLEQLYSAGNDVLGDKKLVENLENSKKMAMEIVGKVSESRMATIKIDEAREQFRPVATRASILYFIMTDLDKINSLYQFSLKAFSAVFHKAIVTSRPSNNMQVRIANLMDNITFSVYTYVNRSLFQADRLTFLTLLTIQILCNAGEINMEELDFLLRFPVLNGVTSPVDFLSNKCWGAIKNLSMMDEFRGLDRDIESSTKRWKKFVEGGTPEREKLPQEWKSKTGLQKLCIMRTLRPDRMIHAVRCFVEEKLSIKYLEARNTDFATTYKETNSTTPVVFILSPGVDPMNDVESLGTSLNFTEDKQNLYSVSLGQGQEVTADRAIDRGMKYGHWVVLQNVHLVRNWLPTLEKKIGSAVDNAHPNYRLFISLEPSASHEYHSIPQGILESSIKITNEPPTGMLANLHKAWDNFDQNTLEMCSKEIEFKTILFALCYFHACVAERRKFGPQGWNYMYPFNSSDLTICAHVLYNYLESNFKIPWEDLIYLFGEIMYGGHITDDWDRRLCQTYLRKFLCPQLLEGEFMLAPNFPVPTNRDYPSYHNYIDTALPSESPILYGLHANTEIGLLSTEADNLFKMILELYPHDTSISSTFAISREDKVKQMLDEILDKIPDEFNLNDMSTRIEERTPYVIVALQECERMNSLTREIKSSLQKLSLSLKGELPFTSDLEELEEFIFLDKVPRNWELKAYPSLLGLSAWFIDLLARIKELEAWTTDFSLPLSMWLGGLFNPQAFLSAIIQSTANKNEWPLDKMTLHCEVTKKQKDELTTVPREGVFIHGLHMEGARWDSELGCVTMSKLKELHHTMPVIYVKGVIQDKQDVKDTYECPVYRTRQRASTYVTSFNLKTKENPSKWILSGTALLLSV